jgi:hypothetical protein
MNAAPILRRSLLLLVIVGVDGACSSDANFAGWGQSGIGGIGGGAGANADGAAGDGGPDGAGNLVTGVRVFSGNTATLLFNGPSCTQEGGATGDRWCGFVAFSDATMQARSLYVFNASRAAAGTDVRCDAATTGNAGADCLLLTADLGGDGGSPVLHGTFFQGDTLVYYEHGLAPYAWRPGMTKGRLLATFATGEDAVLCTPAPRGTAVLCVLLPVVEPDLNPTVGLATLLIGKADGATEPLLSPADDVVVWSAADAGFRPTFSFGFPPGPGDHVAWTTRAGGTGPETLRLQRAGDAASKVTIASDVHDWDVTPDAKRWFWVAGTQGTGLGTLQTAPFPAGTNPTDVRAEVSDYSIAPSDGKTIVAVNKDRALIAIADPIAATGEVTLDTGVEMVLSLSDAGHVAYIKKRLATNSGDLYVKKIDGSATCVAETARPVPFRSVSFVPNAGAILWAHSYTDGFEAHYTRLGDCNTMPVATDITLLESVGHARVLFMDTFDDVSVSGTLRVRLVGSDNALAGAPVPIADHVDSYAIAGPAPNMLLYTVNARNENDGVYVRAFAD